MNIIKKHIICAVYLLISCFWLVTKAGAQTPLEIRKADKLFSGFWIDRKTSRQLLIGVEKDGYVIINDWTGKMQDRGSADAYTANIKGGKLIMPPDLEHHAPYAEILIQERKLIYLTKFKDITGKPVVTRQTFVRRN